MKFHNCVTMRTSACPVDGNLKPCSMLQCMSSSEIRSRTRSIKGVLDARKTGTVYPDADEPQRQLFEYLLIVQLNADWTLRAIYEFNWSTFVKCRSWDKRMNAWYMGLAAKTLAQATKYT